MWNILALLNFIFAMYVFLGGEYAEVGIIPSAVVISFAVLFMFCCLIMGKLEKIEEKLK